MTRIVSAARSPAATNCVARHRPLRAWLALAAALCGLLATAGCSYIFSEKRTVYQYDPAYGVDSPQFLRSLDGLGTEMVPGNAARLLENGDAIFPEMLAAIAAARESINLEIYIFDHGAIATRFAEALS